MAKSSTPRTDAAEAWLSQARKGDVFTYWRGNLERTCRTPEQNMSNQERRDHQAACRAAKKANKQPPRPPDHYKDERPDARKIVEWADRQELRGLIETRVVCISKDERVYEAECLVQRNGLSSIRKRK